MNRGVSRRTFHKGLDAVASGRFLEALAYFEAAIQIETRAGVRMPMPYLSYYGLSLAMATGNKVNEAREICERAVRTEFFNPDLYLNLARVCVRTGDRQAAFNALVGGLKLNPRHAGLIREIRHMGLRRQPMLPFFDRASTVNRMLGRLRQVGGRHRVSRPVRCR